MFVKYPAEENIQAVKIIKIKMRYLEGNMAHPSTFTMTVFDEVGIRNPPSQSK